MKRFIFLVMLAIAILSSCSTKHFVLGMNEQDFLIHNHSATLVSSPANETVYKITVNGFGHLPSPKFLHFQNGKLVKVDGDNQQPGLSYVGLN